MIQKFQRWNRTIRASRRGGLYVASILVLFICIGLITTMKPAYHLSSDIITKWTNEIDSTLFSHVLGMEYRLFDYHLADEAKRPRTSEILLQLATSIKIDDPRTFLGGELPGFNNFGSTIIVAGEGMSHSNLSIESSPPLKHVLEEREAIFEEAEDEEEQEELTTDGRDVVFIYNTHNRESFLPHLPDVTDPNKAFHSEVNITKVSEHFAQELAKHGIGSQVDDTDVMNILHENDWTYGQSYRASRPIVEEAVATNKDLQYIFDFHRDSLPRDKSTKEIDGKNYAKILFVIGAEFPTYEKNVAFATELHYLIEENYPGLSRGVLTKEGAGTNGIYNQDLHNNALLIEFGGYENTLEELYNSAEVVAEVFSSYYWDAEKVSTNE